MLEEAAAATAASAAADFICYGDHMGLYCEDTQGYAFCSQNSSVHTAVYLRQNQHGDRPQHVPNPQVLAFEVCVQNRYKLSKKYRKLAAEGGSDAATDGGGARSQAAALAEAERVDNIAEQKRQLGKRVRYGDIVQLRHTFSGKYIHVSTTEISRRDKNNMLVFLAEYNSKNAQFKVRPRYKVKVEGEYVAYYDRVVFESIKSPSQFFHASSAPPAGSDNYHTGCELNLGNHPAAFTLVKIQRPRGHFHNVLKGGSVIQLFHKDLEAYLVAEGLFDDIVTEDVHLRVREVLQLDPRTLYPSTSGATYWQVEKEASILHGSEVEWGQQVRLRHMCTRRYLAVNDELEIELVEDGTDPHTVFRLHPVTGSGDAGAITFMSFMRIENVLSGTWLHGLRDSVYLRRQPDQGVGMGSLRWDDADLRKVSAKEAKMYHDVYTVQQVVDAALADFNFVAAMVPIITALIVDRQAGKPLSMRRASHMVSALRELENFMLAEKGSDRGTPVKRRQKLLRNLRVVDLLVKLLRFPLEEAADKACLARVFCAAYAVLHTYLRGDSRKNALYCAPYITFFQTQFTLYMADLGLQVVEMVTECIRNNRSIVDHVTEAQVVMFVGLLKTAKNYRYLDLLSALCVCDGVAMAENQTLISEHWLKRDKERRARYLTERGQNVNETPNVVYVSTDTARSWTPLHVFVDTSSETYNEEEVRFFEHQLDLFSKISYGRNEFAIWLLTVELRVLGWDEAFLSLTSTQLPHTLRAKYAELIIGLFIDVGTNYSVVDQPSLSFIYEDVQVGAPDADGHYVKKLPRMDNWIMQDGIIKDLVSLFPVIREWIEGFLAENQHMTASEVGLNKLIQQVMRLFYFLVKFGYYSSDDLRSLLRPLLSLLDGAHDRPFPPDAAGDKGGYTKASQKVVDKYQQKDRYEVSPETTAIVNAKYQVLEVLDLLLAFQFNTRIESFISKFKLAATSDSPHHPAGARSRSFLSPLLYKHYDATGCNKGAVKSQKKVLRDLKDMFDLTAYFNADQIYTYLIDLTNYRYDHMLNKALLILSKVYTCRTELFRAAVNGVVLTTTDSCHVHREVARTMPILRRYSQQRPTHDQVKKMVEVLEKFTGFCKLPHSDERHPMNQHILINHEILSFIFDTLNQKIDSNNSTPSGVLLIRRKSLLLLAALAHQNTAVHARMFERLDMLLAVEGANAELATALRQIFVGNQGTCLKILPRQIRRIVDLVARHKEKAPEFLSLLTCIVKVEGMGVCLKRNQELVIKYFMQDYAAVGYILERDLEFRLAALTGQEESGGAAEHRDYLLNLITLLATCAEGENRFVESMCQKLVPVEELLSVVLHADVAPCHKAPFLHFLTAAFIMSGLVWDQHEAATVAHHSAVWQFVSASARLADDLAAYVGRNRDTATTILANTAGRANPPADSGLLEHVAHGQLLYFLDAVLPTLHAFYSKCYEPEVDGVRQHHEVDITDQLARHIVSVCESVISLVRDPAHLETIVSVTTTVIPHSNLPHAVAEGLLEQVRAVNRRLEVMSKGEVVGVAGLRDYYTEEVVLNAKLRTFAVNCSLVYGGHNTVRAQLKVKSDRAYTDLEGDESLPLGEEFQEHLRRFLRPGEKKITKRLELAQKLIAQLAISSRLSRGGGASGADLASCERRRCEQEELDLRSLQLLRAIIHNEERRLPEDWEEHAKQHRRQVELIYSMQMELNRMGAITHVLPHACHSASTALCREVLAFVAIMMFNANQKVQSSLLHFFNATREEAFFATVRDRMQIAAMALKEKRALLTQQRLRERTLLAAARGSCQAISSGRALLQEIAAVNSSLQKSRIPERQLSLDTLQKRSLLQASTKGAKKKQKVVNPPTKEETDVQNEENLHHEVVIQASSALSYGRKGLTNGNLTSTPSEKETLMQLHTDETIVIQPLVNGKAAALKKSKMNKKKKKPEKEKSEVEGSIEDVAEEGDMGNLELVLKVLARMCDGQHSGLQDYMRQQDDNLTSFNLVAETTSFLSLVYSRVGADNIHVTTQLFSTLNEFCSGNHQNQSVILGCKVIDFINLILRAGEFHNCSLQKIFELKKSIADVITTLIEENGPECTPTANEVKDSIDKEALLRCMGASYEVAMASDVATPRCDREAAEDVGLTYYLILARLIDLDPTLAHIKDRATHDVDKTAFNHYRRNCLSIEIVKDDSLQKINFSVKNKGVLREEVKEKMIWAVDRTSPSNKIRDMISWSKDIINDVAYQRRIMGNPVTRVFTKQWGLWNKVTMLLSLTINILMLVTWNARATLDSVAAGDNVTELPPELADPTPLIHLQHYQLIMWVLGGTHNFFSLLVFICYFLANHPRLPRLPSATNLRQLCSKKSTEDDGDADIDEGAEDEEEASNIQVNLFSVATLYYIIFLGFSAAGTYYQGYFFAFHLLNIITTNQLLKGVIQAVTKNGRSLLWVAVLGFIIFYIYALISFALLRSSFANDSAMYCATLWQCTVTVIRYGLIGEIFDNLGMHPSENSFWRFGLIVIYHVSFFIFITTIGLNIIFGIIVDTFSELRDLKWQTEQDIRENCFICSRSSYDFEHYSVGGWEAHVRREHDMWAYVHFFIHLHDTKFADLSALELYVLKLFEKNKGDFFPVNRAMSLANMDGDSTETKIDDLLNHVLTLVEGQRAKEQKKKQEVERVKQYRWRERHYQATSAPASVAVDTDYDLGTNPGGSLTPGQVPSLLRRRLQAPRGSRARLSVKDCFLQNTAGSSFDSSKTRGSSGSGWASGRQLSLNDDIVQAGNESVCGEEGGGHLSTHDAKVNNEKNVIENVSKGMKSKELKQGSLFVPAQNDGSQNKMTNGNDLLQERNDLTGQSKDTKHHSGRNSTSQEEFKPIQNVTECTNLNTCELDNDANSQRDRLTENNVGFPQLQQAVAKYPEMGTSRSIASRMSSLDRSTLEKLDVLIDYLDQQSTRIQDSGAQLEEDETQSLISVPSISSSIQHPRGATGSQLTVQSNETCLFMGSNTAAGVILPQTGRLDSRSSAPPITGGSLLDFRPPLSRDGSKQSHVTFSDEDTGMLRRGESEAATSVSGKVAVSPSPSKQNVHTVAKSGQPAPAEESSDSRPPSAPPRTRRHSRDQSTSLPHEATSTNARAEKTLGLLFGTLPAPSQKHPPLPVPPLPEIKIDPTPLMHQQSSSLDHDSIEDTRLVSDTEPLLERKKSTQSSNTNREAEEEDSRPLLSRDSSTHSEPRLPGPEFIVPTSSGHFFPGPEDGGRQASSSPPMVGAPRGARPPYIDDDQFSDCASYGSADHASQASGQHAQRDRQVIDGTAPTAAEDEEMSLQTEIKIYYGNEYDVQHIDESSL